MKKIMFEEQHGLQQAVLNGNKTMTRRVVNFSDSDLVCIDDSQEAINYIISKYAKYQVGDVVAIAQSYRSFLHFNTVVTSNGKQTTAGTTAGWENKMFVSADMMPHHIEITDVRFELLQDISDEECMKEGVLLDESAPKCYCPFYTFKGSLKDDTPVGWHTPRKAFAELIDKVSGKGTWDKNPWVAVYEFKLIK